MDDKEIREEIEAHLRMAIRDRVERGESQEQARAAVMREFGNRTQIQESTRAVWVWTAIEQLLQDLRHALRIFVQSPLFAAAAVLLIAVGIGGNTTIFSMVNAIINKPMPAVLAREPGSISQRVDGG